MMAFSALDPTRCEKRASPEATDTSTLNGSQLLARRRTGLRLPTSPTRDDRTTSEPGVTGLPARQSQANT
jgi:hypothetical protein